MKSWIKNWIKDKFLVLKVRNRFNASVQVNQRQLYHYYKNCLRTNQLPLLSESGFRVFSQFEEDGILLFIFSIIGMDNKVFIEIGSDDGVNSNSANLYFNFGWHGLFIDANPKSIRRGIRFFDKYPHPWFYKPKFVCSKVTRENINQLIIENGYQGEVGLLSIDIDGNDYWIWDAIKCISPRVVVIETHNCFGLENIIAPYDPEYVYPGKHPLYHGASPVAMTNLGKKKGYRLVGANDLGFNFIFIRNDLAVDEIPEVLVESVLRHPNVKEGGKDFIAIKNWDFQKG
nr:hypothetical protein [uncultured Carboxylicivirga sp.]